MYATERHEAIELLLAAEGRVSVVELARRFDVTTETARRDLAHLEEAGVLRRVHGGAVPRERESTMERSLAQRTQHRGGAKAAIARRAADVVPADFQGSIYFDAGTTTGATASAIGPRLSNARIDVVTHSVALAHALAQIPAVSLSVIGGRVRPLTAAAVGADTVRAVERIRPDIAFIGTNGLSRDFGLSTPDPDEAAVKTAIVRSARRVVVVADSDKLGRELLVGFAPLASIDILVTDAAPAAALADALAEADVEVWIA